MARPRPSLSITLPPGFEFHYNDGQLPRTPDQGEEARSAVEPPPPPKQKYTVKRRRAEPVPVPFEEPPFLPDPDTVVPTIEMSEAIIDTASPILEPTPASNGLLAPLPAVQRMLTPQTPAPRLTPFSQQESPVSEWSLITDSRYQKKPSFQRSTSVCSGFSDSSVSSCGSSGFSAPNGSCNSPESEATDPFMEDDMSKTEKLVLSPEQGYEYPQAKRVKRQRHAKWTPEMDQHLENTYMRYLADPRVTPFKTLPGVPPPLGVCNRVSMRARQTWGHRRTATPSPLDTILESAKSAREGSPDTIRPGKEAKKQPWAHSDAATRRRLRKLVKRKSTLSAHYLRLLRTRSPSPFPSSSATTRSSEPPPSAFSGHDMKMSLITSTAPSMQPEGPLAQLASDDALPPEDVPARPESQRVSRPADWFARIGRSQAHNRSVSMQSGLSLETDIAPTAASLASPFDEVSSRSHLLHSMSTTKSLGRSEFNKRNGKGPSLDSPFDMPMAMPTLPRSLKRRFKSDEEKPRRPVLEDVFGPPTEDVGIVRNRGFSVGAVRANDNLAKIFEPPVPIIESTPAPADHEMVEAPPVPDSSDLGPIGSRSAPRRLAEPIPRLGSPFVETPCTNRLFNTFPRSYIPTTGNPQPFQDRLRELAAERNQS